MTYFLARGCLDEQVIPQASSTLYPTSYCAGFSVLPGNVWVLEVGRQYQITVHVFDKLNHPILVTEVWSTAAFSLFHLLSIHGWIWFGWLVVWVI